MLTVWRGLALGGVCVTGFLAAAIPAPAATASFIVYRCGERLSEGERYNLCRVDADGRGRRALTTDGSGPSGAYAEPSLSRDGTRLAFTFADRLRIAGPDATSPAELGPRNVDRVALSPDGSRIAYTHYEERPGEPYPENPTLFTIGSDGTGLRRVRPAVLSVGWLGDRLVGEARDVPGRPICLLSADGSECERVLADDPDARVSAPALSPDGKRMVAVVDSGGLALYSVRRGRRLRYLTDDILAEHPTWSPDGEAVAYESGGDIRVVDTRGLPVVQGLASGGDTPTWGGAAGSRDARLRLTGIRIRGRRLSFAGHLARSARARLHITFVGIESAGYVRPFRPRPRRGGFRVTARIPRRYLYYCRLIATYPGDARLRRATITSRVRGGICKRDPD